MCISKGNNFFMNVQEKNINVINNDMNKILTGNSPSPAHRTHNFNKDIRANL